MERNKLADDTLNTARGAEPGSASRELAATQSDTCHVGDGVAPPTPAPPPPPPPEAPPNEGEGVTDPSAGTFKPWWAPIHANGRLCSCTEAAPHTVKVYVYTGYRREAASSSDHWGSLLYLHNETGSIYTHLVAALSFTAIVVHFQSAELQLEFWDNAFVAVFFASSYYCFVASATFHIFCAGCVATYNRALSCDLTGIVMEIVGSFYLALWLAFRCSPTARAVYMILISIFNLPLLLIASNIERFMKNYYLVVGMFSGVVASGIVPGIHYVATHDMRGAEEKAMLGAVVGTLGCYAIGLGFYATAFPECVWPGRHDYVLSSHQLWHLFVFFAPVVLYVNVFTILQGIGKGDFHCNRQDQAQVEVEVSTLNPEY